VRPLTLPILSWQYCLCGLWEGSLTTVVGFSVALDSVNDGTLVRPAAHISCGTVRVKHSPGDFSLGLVTLTGSPIHRTLLQQTFFMGVLKAQVFTHTLPDINSFRNAIRQENANVTQDTLRRVKASVPGRWQQCLDCHGGHLQDVILKT